MIDTLSDADQLAIKINDVILFCRPMIMMRKIAKYIV